MSDHVGVKYQCDQCESKFTDKGYLRIHKMSEHVGVKYQCESEFNLKVSLRAHKMSVHVGVKYQCDRCESKFTDKGYLRIHKMSEHEGIKYQCESKLIEKRNLKKHKMALQYFTNNIGQKCFCYCLI